MGAAAAGVVASGSVRTTSASEDRYGITFDTVLDAVDDLDMDPTGGTPIDDALDEAYGDGTLIEFPPGEYLIEWTHFFNDDVSAFGMMGTGSSPDDVTFVLPHGDTKGQKHREYNQSNFGWDDDEHHLLAVYSGSDHLLANFSIQQDEVTGTGITLFISDGIHIEDVYFRGFNPVIDYAQGTNLRPNVTDPDGTGVVRNVVCTGGGVQDVYPSRKVLCLSGVGHKGELLYDDLHVENMGSHPIYASNTYGCIRVENSVFKNNDNTNLRISGRHPDKRSWVKNCTVVVDIDNAENLPDGESYQGARGIKCDYGDDVLIENTDVSVLSGPPASYAIGFQHNHGDGSSGARSSIVRDTRIRCDVDGYTPLEGQPNDGHVVIDNVSVTGSGDYRDDAGIVINDRPADVKNSCLQLGGDGTNGVLVEWTDDCTISDTNINVDGKATVFDNATVTTSNITYDDSCPVASTDGSTSDGSTDGGTTDGLDRTLTVVSDDDSLVEYLVEIEGEAEAITEGDNPGGDYDDVTTQGGVTTIDGVTSEGRGDSWAFSGPITSFDMSGTGTVFVDGEETAEEQVAPDAEEKLAVVSATDSLVNYTFTVDGPVEAVGSGNRAGGDYDDVTTEGDLTTVEGVTSKGRGDTWLFGGEMTDFSMSGTGSVSVNGTEVDPTALPLDNTLRIDATTASDVVSYSVTTSDSLAPDSSGGPIEDSDTVSGTAAEGVVSGDVDAYRFAGNVTDLSVDGDAVVFVNGGEVDPSNYGSGLDHELKIVADAETVLDYTFTVDGPVEAAGSGDMAGGDYDDVSTDGNLTTVEGVTSDGGGDRWRFGGEIVDFTLQEDGAVYLDGTQVDPADLGTSESATLPHHVVFDGSGSSGTTTYEFSVSGDVAKSPDLGSMEAGDELADGTVTGSVETDVDGFRFSGDLTALDVDGTADVEFE